VKYKQDLEKKVIQKAKKLEIQQSAAFVKHYRKQAR
jgi:hypothetical protein